MQRQAVLILAMALIGCNPFSGNDGPAGAADGIEDASTDTGDAADGASGADAGPVVGAGSALEFPGNAFVNADFLDFSNIHDLTIEAWVKPDALPSGEAVIVAEDQSNVNAAQLRLVLNGNGTVYFTMSDAAGEAHGTSTNLFATVTKLPAKAWSHIAFVKLKADFCLYVNGVLDKQQTFADFTRNGPQLPLRIGARVASPTVTPDSRDYFIGTIDEVRIWKVARTAKDIVLGMSHEIPETDPSFVNLLSYFRFDDGSGLKAVDTVHQRPAGTLMTVGSAVPAWVSSKAF